MPKALKCIIIGIARHDFHDFQMFFKERPDFRVLAFTATQIPFIEARCFPRELAGAGYEAAIPIYPESELPELIRRFDIDFVFLSYSDLSYAELMHKASLVQACGASFALLGPRHTQLVSRRPVIAVTAVRTGAGKSPIAQMLARHLRDSGYRVGIIRHPMPYGDLSRQVVQRLATSRDLDESECTIEEREEYEPYIDQGLVVFAGVDYRAVLSRAEKESDVILWDGGNNDFAFVRSDLSIVVVDALRPGHEIEFYPGETNLRSADVLVVNKVGSASFETLAKLRQRIHERNPNAEIVEGDLDVNARRPELIQGRSVLVVEDGPTLTHGGMKFGAGVVAAQKYNAASLVDPRPHATGSVAKVLAQYPDLECVLPAVGYSAQQREDLTETIEKCGAEVVIDASPASLEQALKLSLPVVRVSYDFRQTLGTPLTERVVQMLDGFKTVR